jgi:hypothetical protein
MSNKVGHNGKNVTELAAMTLSHKTCSGLTVSMMASRDEGTLETNNIICSISLFQLYPISSEMLIGKCFLNHCICNLFAYHGSAEGGE